MATQEELKKKIEEQRKKNEAAKKTGTTPTKQQQIKNAIKNAEKPKPAVNATANKTNDLFAEINAKKKAALAAQGGVKPGVVNDPPKVHKLAADETLSHVALKYYGHATPEYWQLIYNANKAAIGDNPAYVRVGMELVIPPLPENMKK